MNYGGLTVIKNGISVTGGMSVNNQGLYIMNGGIFASGGMTGI